MDGLVMCGGRGTRLDAATEKTLHEIRDRALVDRVLDALEASRLDDVYAVTSPHTPETRRHLENRRPDSIVDGLGEGYVQDLQYALDELGVGESSPILTVAADLPLLAGDAIDRVLDVYDAGSLTVCTPASLPETLDVSTDAAYTVDGRTVVPSGVNVVGGDPDETWVTWDARFAVNVNYPRDAAVAERLLSGTPE